MGRVRQVSLDPRRTKRVFECLYYHGKDLCMGCREMVCSTLSHLRGHRNMPWERRSADTSYTCDRLATTYGGTYCQYLPGEPVDAFVSQWVLTALKPAALTLSLEATAHLEQERQALDQLWQQRLERAAYEAERAARH